MKGVLILTHAYDQTINRAEFYENEMIKSMAF